MPFGVRITLHTHPWAQVAYTSRGVLRVATADSTWMVPPVPPSRAIWVPPNVTHEVVIVEDAFMLTLYVDASVILAGLGPVAWSKCHRCCARSSPHWTTPRSRGSASKTRKREQMLGTLALDEIIRSQPLPYPCRCPPKSACAPCATRGSPIRRIPT